MNTDDYKRAQDRVAELRERGIADIHRVEDMRSFHPEGVNAALDFMLKNKSLVKDQSQEQRGLGREKQKENLKRLKDD